MPNSADHPKHTAHDELLIVRLYDGDVDEREHARATDLVANCEECAALFADLSSIAVATEALPTPPRPRDFALTEADAARLRPDTRRWAQDAARLRPDTSRWAQDAARLRSGSGLWARLAGLGRRRSFGGALVALGFSGLLLTSALTLLGGGATVTNDSLQRAPFAAAATAAPALPVGVGNGANPVDVPAPATPDIKAIASPATLGAGDSGLGGVQISAVPQPAASPAALGPEGSPAHDQTTASAPLTPAGVETGGLTPQTQPPLLAPAAESGPDARLLVLGGSAALLSIGLLVLIVPFIRRRRRGGAVH
jgi:hypothetical protein